LFSDFKQFAAYLLASAQRCGPMPLPLAGMIGSMVEALPKQ
jgi:hypothetical protein